MFLGRSIAQTQNVSDDTARLIDAEVRRIIEEAEERARDALTTHIDGLHAVAKGLLDYETLSGDEVRGILAGEPVVRKDASDDHRPSGKSAIPSIRPGLGQGRQPGFGGPQVQPQG